MMAGFLSLVTQDINCKRIVSKQKTVEPLLRIKPRSRIVVDAKVSVNFVGSMEELSNELRHPYRLRRIPQEATEVFSWMILQKVQLVLKGSICRAESLFSL